MLEFNEHGMVNRQKLNAAEIRAFIAFLKSEKYRHQEDIKQINQDLREMQKRRNDLLWNTKQK